MWRQAPPQERRRCSSYTPWTMPVPVLPTMRSPLSGEVLVNSMDSLTCTGRPWLLTVLPVSIVDLFPRFWELSYTAVFTLDCTTLSVSRSTLYVSSITHSSLEPVVLVGAFEGSFLASFGLAFGATTVAGVVAYPLDTLRYVTFFCGGDFFILTKRVVVV